MSSRHSLGALRAAEVDLQHTTALHWQRFLAPDESAAQMFSRTKHTEPLRTGVPFIDRHVTLRAGEVLEVCGESGSGKTEVVMLAAVVGVLPRLYNGVSYGGNEGGVVLMDLDGKFDMHRFMQLLEARVTATHAVICRERRDPHAVSAAHETAVYELCLRRLYVVRCDSSYSMLLALHTLPTTLHRMAQAGEPARLLLMDSVSAFYCVDRMARTVPLPEPHRSHLAQQGVAPLNAHAVARAAAHSLRRTLRAAKLPLLLTSGAISRSLVEFLPSAWRELVQHRVRLQAPTVDGGGQLRFCAQWEMPPRDTVEAFRVAAAGLTMA